MEKCKKGKRFYSQLNLYKFYGPLPVVDASFTQPRTGLHDDHVGISINYLNCNIHFFLFSIYLFMVKFTVKIKLFLYDVKPMCKRFIVLEVKYYQL
jgi:hypothetical protein